MAFGTTGAFGAGGISTSSGNSVAELSLNTVPVGALVVVRVSKDNVQTTDGNTNEVTSVTDTRSNTWTKAYEHCNGNGSAAAGAVSAVFFSVLTTQIEIGDSITANFSSNVVSKSIACYRHTVGAGSTVAVAGAAGGLSNDAADPGSITVGSLSSAEYLAIRAIASESNSTTALTVTSSYTASAQSVANSGTSATSMATRGEFLISTATSFTSDPTLFSADHSSVLVVLSETPAPLSFAPAALALATTFPSATVDQAQAPAALALVATFPTTVAATPPAPGAADSTTWAGLYAAAGQPDWTRLWIIKPDRTLGALCDDMAEAEIEILAFEHGQATVRFHKSCMACQIEYDGRTSLEDNFDNYGLNFYYRDPGDGSKKRFMGIASPYERSWERSEKNAFITITFINAFAELMSRRQVFTETGLRYHAEGMTPDNIARDMIGKAFETGKVVTPTDCTWDRTVLGSAVFPWTVTVEALKTPGDHPDEMDYYIDHGTNLREALYELFLGLVPDTETPTSLWPVLTEPSPGHFHVEILFGRTGSGRTVGVDRSSLVFAPERQNLTAYRESGDRAVRATAIAIRGKFIGQADYETYVQDDDQIDLVGVIENSWQAPEADTADELRWEGLLHLHKLKAGIVTFEAEVSEGPGMIFGEHVNVGDTVTVYSGQESFDAMSTKDILGARIQIPAPGWPKITYILGAFERNPLAEGRRSGGGGGRSGGGGRPRTKSGEEGTGCASYQIEYDTGGNQVKAQNCGQEIGRYGEATTAVFIKTLAAETDGTGYGEGQPNGLQGTNNCDTMTYKVRGFYKTPCPPCTGYVEIYTSNAGLIGLLASNSIAGAGTEPPTG